MNRKKNCLVSSTPHPERTRHLLNLFDNIDFSPITEPDAQPKGKPLLKPIGVQPTGVVRKRRIVSKGVSAAPESVTAGVLQELGVKDPCAGNDILSQSRNRYNMFPEPILLDSDNEETSLAIKKPVKKLKQDSKISQSSTTKRSNVEEPVPGNSRAVRLTRPVADRKLRKQINKIQQLNSVPSSSKDQKSLPQTKKSRNQPPTCPGSIASVVILDDDDDNLFPEYQPGSSVYKASTKIKCKERVRLSVDLDEEFPIEWSQRRQKNTDENADEDPNIENIEVRKSNKRLENHKENKQNKHMVVNKASDSSDRENIDALESNEDEKNNNRKRTTKHSKLTKPRGKDEEEVIKKVEKKDKIVPVKDREVEVKDGQVLISRFEDVTFRAIKASGAVIARSLKTDHNDFGYLEVPARSVFSGTSANITFVAIEGKARVLHLGTEQTLVPGDMLHIRDDSGFQFESAGSSHVRFLYIRPH